MTLAFYNSLLPPATETINCIKKYGFIETGKGKWRNGFTEIRKLGPARFAINSIMSDKYHITNIEDMETYCKYFLKLNGY